MKKTRPTNPANAGTKGTKLAAPSAQPGETKSKEIGAERRKVRGLSKAHVLDRFPQASRPSKMTEEFACCSVWWWRRLPAMVTQYEERMKVKGALPRLEPQAGAAEDCLAMLFRDLSKSKTPQFERMVKDLFDREVELRINGGAKWQPIPHVGNFYQPPSDFVRIRIEMEIPANSSDEYAAERFLRKYHKAQADAGIPRVKLNRSNAFRSIYTKKNGENGWARRFHVIELLDRWAWGLETDNNKLAQVRKLFRERGLVKGW